MSDVYFIADLHFQHKNILNLERKYRPFVTIEQHDKELVAQWNKTITEHDKVYVLGDFAFKDISIADQLNGNKVLVLGNHDYKSAEEYAKYFTRVCGVATYRDYVLTHIPVHISQKSRFKGNIHGHLHHNLIQKDQSIKDEDTNTDPFYISCSLPRLPGLAPIRFKELLGHNHIK